MEDQRFYEYYIGVKSSEHLLSATEIAQLYGIATENGDPHSKLVSSYLNDYCEYEIFYRTGKGHMMRVYRKEEYHNHLSNLIKSSSLIDSKIKSITLENGVKSITYKYTLTNIFN